MQPIQQAQARQHTYTLFSRLSQQGITADLLPYLQGIPELAPQLPDPFDPEEAAADHYNLFVFNIYPNAAIFLDDTRLLGGPITNAYSALYQQNHFLPDSAVEPDHLSQSLAYLAHLSQYEARALENDQSPGYYQNQQHHFLKNHLLPWLIPCTIAIQQENHPFYTQLTNLTLALTADHNAILQPINQPAGDQPSTQSTSYPITNYQLPFTNSTTLRDIARFLITPIYSGIYLSRSAITRLARRLNLPHGFGSRDQMLQTLLQGAGQYDATSQLFTALHDILTTWQKTYQQIAQEHPQIASHIPPWQTRVTRTHQLLTQMQSQINDEQEAS